MLKKVKDILMKTAKCKLSLTQFLKLYFSFGHIVSYIIINNTKELKKIIHRAFKLIAIISKNSYFLSLLLNSTFEDVRLDM